MYSWFDLQKGLLTHSPVDKSRDYRVDICEFKLKYGLTRLGRSVEAQHAPTGLHRQTQKYNSGRGRILNGQKVEFFEHNCMALHGT